MTASAPQSRPTHAALALALLLALALPAGCGGGPADGPARRSLPAVPVEDLATRERVELSSLTPASRPVALWLWGPGCAICRGDATAVDRFAARERARVTVVGLGSHGSPESAPRFVREHDLSSMRVLWDQRSLAWDRLLVPAEPVTIVLDRSGQEVERWFGPFDEGRVLRAAGGAS
ncbi:MAG: hypothetical protein H0U12_11920 [Thermoleophilaceae bacterium]|nr:hypothetical protein [Thermoleophilaceae bacterium]